MRKPASKKWCKQNENDAEMKPKGPLKRPQILKNLLKDASENRCENLMPKSGAAGWKKDQRWLPRGSIFGPAGGVGGGRYLITPDILEDS